MTALAIPHLRLPRRLTGDEAFAEVAAGLRWGLREAPSEAWKNARDKLIQWAGYSNNYENFVLDRSFGDPATALSAADPTFLALTTVAVAETDTGSTITEANYTGYARKSIAAADMGAASGGSKSNTAQQQFANATGGSSVVIGWATCVASTAGDVILFGTCTSTTISSTQTPATIAVGALSATLD